MSNTSSFTGRQRFGSHLGLERITKICEALGNPQEQLKTVHIAGTNGKGSVAAFISSVLRAAGLRVGLFTSPHLMDYRERFQINGELIDPQELTELHEEIEQTIQQIEVTYPQYGPVTEFEMNTALALLYFQRSAVDVSVIEVGLGGRLDATNVVNPELSIITPVSFDHMDWLGNTIEEIATEKAGIIKSQRPVVMGLQLPGATRVIKDRAQALAAPLYQLAATPWQIERWDFTGGRLTFPQLSDRPFDIRLVGCHQLENAATALLGIKVLIERGWNIDIQAIYDGLHLARWPGRLELVSENPWILLDGAHNQAGISSLAKTLEQLQDPLTFIVGMLENKDVALIDPLLPLAKEFIFTKPASSRIPAKDPEMLRHYVQSKGLPSRCYPTLHQALDSANAERICICGSLYLIGEAKKVLAPRGICWQ